LGKMHESRALALPEHRLHRVPGQRMGLAHIPRADEPDADGGHAVSVLCRLMDPSSGLRPPSPTRGEGHGDKASVSIESAVGTPSPLVGEGSAAWTEGP